MASRGGNRESSTENELVFGLHGLGDGELLAAHGELRLADVVARGPAVEDRVVERDAGVFAAVMAHLCPGRPPRVPSLRAAAASRGRFPVPRAHEGSRRSCGGRRGEKEVIAEYLPIGKKAHPVFSGTGPGFML